MKIQIVSNIDNGKGLERDYRLLRGLLEAWGHEVHGVHFRRATKAEPSDLVIFLEVYEPRLAERAPRRWLIPNAEWWYPQRGFNLDEFDLVLCKTKDALEVFAPLLTRVGPAGKRVRYLGFFSEDRLDPNIPRTRRFLHVPGGSTAKGTDVVLATWERYRIPYPLTIVSSLSWPRRPRNVEMMGRIDDRWLRFHQNAFRFHLCPSRYEGWGHVIHEGLSVGATVVVPNTPAMNNVDGCALRVPAKAGGTLGIVSTHVVSPEDLRNAVERCMAFTEADLRRIAEAARGAFLAEREECVTNLRLLLESDELNPPSEDSALSKTAAAAALVRAVRAVATPTLRGLFGGVVVVGDNAEALAEDVRRLCGLATSVVGIGKLAKLPANHACGAILSDVFTGATPEQRTNILADVRRVVKAAGPLIIAETGRAYSASGGENQDSNRPRGDVSVQIEYSRT